jgi:uncharacterized protein YneF (UPF0154 family)
MSTFPPPAPAPKKTSPIVWILAAVGGLLVLVVLLVMAGGFFLVRKVKQAGFDTELMKKNPGLASIKMMAALNPNIEIVSTDESRGIVTVRDKRNGKTFTVNFEDAKKGKFSMTDDKNQSVTISSQGEGSNGAVEIKSSDGTTKIGGGDTKVPAWIPDYPGSQPQGAFSSESGSEKSGMFTFKTKDPVDKIVRFYEDGFKTGGLKVTTTVQSGNAGSPGGAVQAQDEAGKHNCSVVLAGEGGETTVSVTFSAKK